MFSVAVPTTLSASIQPATATSFFCRQWHGAHTAPFPTSRILQSFHAPDMFYSVGIYTLSLLFSNLIYVSLHCLLLFILLYACFLVCMVLLSTQLFFKHILSSECCLKTKNISFPSPPNTRISFSLFSYKYDIFLATSKSLDFSCSSFLKNMIFVYEYVKNLVFQCNKNKT